MRTQAIKFLEALVLLQTYTEADSVTRESEFNLDHVPLTVKVARPRKLEEEARFVTIINFFPNVYHHEQFLISHYLMGRAVGFWYK